MYLPRIIVTSGEPAGIGPDTCVMLAQSDWQAQLVVAGDPGLLASAAAAMRLPLEISAYDSSDAAAAHVAGTMKVLGVPLAQPVAPGRLDPRNARYVIDMLDRACDGCTNGEFAAMVTAPVQKSVIMDAGIPFTGHTEYLAARTRAALPVMMLLSGDLRVALVTTHLPLADVPRAITPERLRATLRIVHTDLERHFGIASPRILVLGLNPHAGESGHLGREEIDVIEPVVRELQRRGNAAPGAGSRGHRVRAPIPRRHRCRGGHVPRSGAPRAQARGLRQRRERDAGAADPAHQRGPWDRAAAGAHRHRRRREPARRAEPRRGPDRRRRTCRSVSVSASTSCTIRGSSAASSMRSPRFPGNGWSRWDPGAAR